MKQYLIRPPEGMSGIHVGDQSVRFSNGHPEWCSELVAIAVLTRGGVNEGERQGIVPDAEPAPPELPEAGAPEAAPDQIPVPQSNDNAPGQTKTQSGKSFTSALREMAKGKKSNR